MKKILKNYIIAGILVLVPIWVTFAILEYLVTKFDTIISLLPQKYHPDILLGFHVPGLGIVIAIIVILLTGMLTTNFIGKHVIVCWESMLSRIPLVRTIYISVKKTLSTMLTPTGQSFRKVLLIEYPRKDLWTMAFQTGTGTNELSKHLGEDIVTVFVPTTPNPTGGFLLIVKKQDVIELDMSVENALKMIISLGVILPKVE